MTKNKHGGSKHKKYKRARDETGRNDIKILKKTEGQEYAFIQENKGGCRFDVVCWDKKKRLAIVRGKLRKRVWCAKGDIILVSLRDFQDDKCDIIQKYKPEQVKVLINKKEINEAFTKEGKTFITNTNITKKGVSFGLDTVNDVNDVGTEISQPPHPRLTQLNSDAAFVKKQDDEPWYDEIDSHGEICIDDI